MSMMRALRAVGGAVVAGALLLTTAPAASADQVREDQWPLKAFLAEEIWKISQGEGVTVAVIDDGVDASHPDLKDNVLTEKGKDFIDGDGDPSPEGFDDHGTAMASIIAGHGHGPNSSEGVMGLAPRAKILPIRDFGEGAEGFGPSIRYAVDQGASVINISQEGTPAGKPELEAIAYALKKGVLVVAGSGNSGKGPEYEAYPAYYPGVVAVGGVTSKGEIWENSNYSPHILLTAPATGVVTGGGGTEDFPYSKGDGTSNSTAYVSAAAALLMAKFPDLTPGQIVNRLVKTAGLPSSAKDVSLPDERYGYGFIQPLAALKRDIAPGPKMGQLKDPSSVVSQSPSNTPSPPSDDMTQASGDGDGGSLLPVVLAIFGGLVGVALLVVLLVRLRKRNGGPPAGGGGGWGSGSGCPQSAPPFPSGGPR